MKFEIRKLHDQIWLVAFDNRVDLAMHFLCFQEYYESENPSFRGDMHFDMLEYIDWYSKEHDDMFTYPTDWDGFNIPGYVFKALSTSNKYIDFMRRVVNNVIEPEMKGRKDISFYVVGCLIGDLDTLDHELAHAFYGVSKEYKLGCQKLIKEQSELRVPFGAYLTSIGYIEESIEDEVQAYFSTGILSTGLKHLKAEGFGDTRIRNAALAFEKHFKFWKKKLLKE